MQLKSTMTKNFINKKKKKKKLKTLIKYIKGNFGPDDGSFKKIHKDKNLIEAIIKEDLKDEFKENRDII